MSFIRGGQGEGGEEEEEEEEREGMITEEREWQSGSGRKSNSTRS